MADHNSDNWIPGFGDPVRAFHDETGHKPQWDNPPRTPLPPVVAVERVLDEQPHLTLREAEAVALAKNT